MADELFLIFFSEEPAPIPTSTASPTVKVASPVSEQPSSKTVDTSHNPTSPTANKQLDNRKTGKGQCLSLSSHVFFFTSHVAPK